MRKLLLQISLLTTLISSISAQTNSKSNLLRRRETQIRLDKLSFKEGEILESKNGDTRYEMVGVSENNNGVLSGQFYMIMDCWGGAKILCDFTDTIINTDNIVLTTRFNNHPIPDKVVDPDFHDSNYKK